jgi:hypothetical protein
MKRAFHTRPAALPGNTSRALMRRKAGLLLLLLGGLLASCAPAKSTWAGTATQNGGGLSPTYHMHLDLQQRGQRLKGTTFFLLPDNPALFVQFAFRGRLVGNRLELSDYKIVKAAKFNGNWLLKDMVLETASDDGKSLSGTWKAHGATSYQGTLRLKQVILE